MLLFPTASFAAASSAAPAPSAGFGASIAGFVPLVLIFLIFYFLVIRPQQKKLKEHSKLLDSIKKGDKVVASGGLLGTVTKVDASNGHLHIEIATGVEVRVLKSSVSEVLNREGSGKSGSPHVNKAHSAAKG
ncbi:preprotein translocase subunit YajC [Anaplasma capra]|uniref:preprotein translocase subunit YajC n=1 Tax=Anaplasma capra TaxID=1562740 RepID=UPI0021D5833E|nr:preprotein translocase subunit YajC [Anaplasma capra]MCU7611800.1 preprotein translocase subunit YajC [Anaplasma capra]MCU7612643.1 preprotein translocase subunit YajC [Anaplasma capra]